MEFTEMMVSTADWWVNTKRMVADGWLIVADSIKIDDDYVSMRLCRQKFKFRILYL